MWWTKGSVFHRSKYLRPSDSLFFGKKELKMRLQKYSQRFNNGEAIGDFKTWGKREIMGNKDSWTREELVLLFKKHEGDVIRYINGSGGTKTPSFNDCWIKENL